MPVADFRQLAVDKKGVLLLPATIYEMDAGQNVKLLLHQDGHASISGRYVGDQLYEEIINKWLSHYLYGIENGAEDMPEVTVQSNIDGEFATYDSWGDAELKQIKATPENTKAGDAPAVYSGIYDDFFEKYLAADKDPEEFFLSLDSSHAQVYDLKIPEGATIYGVPQVTVKIATENVAQDNLMVSGMLLDEAADGSAFHAYMLKHSLQNKLPVKTVDTYEIGDGHDPGKIKNPVKSPTLAKRFSAGWMDLMDPDAEYVSSKQKESKPLNAGEYYEHTLYLTPTVYTVEKGHTIKLILFAQDPYKSRYDDVEDATPEFNEAVKDPVYTFNIDNTTVDVRLPIM